MAEVYKICNERRGLTNMHPLQDIVATKSLGLTLHILFMPTINTPGGYYNGLHKMENEKLSEKRKNRWAHRVEKGSVSIQTGLERNRRSDV